ncbi:tetraacyldisaccharide 4'-kinase [Mongoliimonas terrestris]|uniref:tetraacyldisaccharide 4'-kinase n=1 Tax=Mongoliimonas terrestris TaxID=1709001 RepID=UPI00094975D3|nr:tetraacyldisaccharide 4'-kinase [Mongoliimonas terrestris]
MKSPEFWWADRGWRAALYPLLLAPAAAVYGGAAARRMARPGVRPPLPIVCVGNYVAGGAGKTPTALALAAIAQARGVPVVFLTRGYGGRLKGPVRVDTAVHDTRAVGDEALLLARSAPTIVSRDRAAAFDLLAESGARLCIMDDGFQNPSVEKALSIVVVDAAVGVGNGRVIPAGPLRAPLLEQMRRTGAVLLVGGTPGPATDPVVRAAARAGRPVLRARLEPQAGGAFAGRRVLAFAGIGRPEKFFEALAAAGAEVVETAPFPDHHAFRTGDARRLLARAEAGDLLPVTTEKDAVRLAHATEGPRAALAARSLVFGIQCVFEDPARIGRMLADAVDRWRRSG